MILIDSDIEEYPLTVKNQNYLYRIVESLKYKVSDHEIISPFNKSDFQKEMTICFYLGGFDIYGLINYIDKDCFYYIQNVTEFILKRKLIFFSKNYNPDIVKKYQRVMYFQYLEGEQKWKKLKI